MSETTYYQINREVMLNRANEHYENNKEASRKRAKNKYRELSEKEKKYEENMKETDIIICLRLKNIFHRCKKNNLY